MLNINGMIKKYFLPFLFLAVLGLQGCGMWGDFTAYFNTYYNASVLFERAAEDVAKLRKDLFEFKEEKISKKTAKDLEQVIEKCSKIFQFHSESAYFEEALLMTGKAFYWRGQYAKALRKFQELASFKESDLILEDKLWIGKTMLQLRDFEKGYAVLEEVKKTALENEEEEILIETLITQIRYKLYRDEYTEAIDLIEELLENSTSEELSAEVTYQLGKIYLKIEERENALKAFAAVQDYEPSFDIEFNSYLEIAKIKKELGEEEESLELLKDLSANEKYEELWDKVDLEIAQILLERGDYEDALSIYLDIDSTYQRSKSAGVAAFNAGKILSEYFYDYDSAMIYFDKSLAADTPPELKVEARKRNKTISDYITIDEKLEVQYTQLKYLLEPGSFERDSLIYVEYLKQDSIKKAEARLAKGNKRGGNYNLGNANKGFGQKIMLRPKRPAISADSLKTLISETEYEMGNLFFGELNVPDSAFFYYSNSLEHNPKTLNKPKILYAMGNYYLTVNDSSTADSLFNYIYDNYKYDRIVNEAAKKIGKPLIDFESDPAEPYYLKAEEHYLNAEYDSAITQLVDLSRLFPNSQFAPQALYTAGFILENELNNADSAASLYDSLVIKYRNTEYSKSVGKKLSFYKRELKHKLDSIKMIQDSIRAANAPPDTLKAEDTIKTKKKSLQEILQQRDEQIKKAKEDDDERGRLSFINREKFYLKKSAIKFLI